MGKNIGAFTATLLCGYLGEEIGWAYGFGAAGMQAPTQAISPNKAFQIIPGTISFSKLGIQDKPNSRPIHIGGTSPAM